VKRFSKLKQDHKGDQKLFELCNHSLNIYIKTIEIEKLVGTSGQKAIKV
jgi:hypothetical protein